MQWQLCIFCLLLPLQSSILRKHKNKATFIPDTSSFYSKSALIFAVWVCLAPKFQIKAKKYPNKGQTLSQIFENPEKSVSSVITWKYQNQGISREISWSPNFVTTKYRDRQTLWLPRRRAYFDVFRSMAMSNQNLWSQNHVKRNKIPQQLRKLPGTDQTWEKFNRQQS